MTKAERRIVSYFKAYTKKKYVLLTDSCRTALLLSYKAINVTGEVITSPLTCKVAIDSIIQSNNEVIYCDISSKSLLVDTKALAKSINNNTVAVQVIHIGGESVDTSAIRDICDRNHLYMIEDCAQGFFAKSNGVVNGQLADVSCFSLIKNAYGIAGGVLATNNKHIFERAKKIYLEVNSNNSFQLITYRILRNILDTYRTSFFGNFLYKQLIALRSTSSKDNREKTIDYHLKLSNIEKKIAYYQLNKAKKLNKKRREVAKELIENLKETGAYVFSPEHLEDNSYTKLHIYHPSFNSAKDILLLNRLGIEAKHLEQKTSVFYQEKLHNAPLKNYDSIHDKLISLPLYEKMNKKEIKQIIRCVKQLINNEEDTY